MSAAPEINLNALLGPVARKLLGEPPRKRLGGREWRYNRKGSLSINVAIGRWSHFQDCVGGGTTALIRFVLKCSEPEAWDWLRREGFITGEAATSTTKASGVTYFNYVDEQSEVLSRVVKGASWYSQERPGPNGTWVKGIKGVRRVLYRLPDALSAVTQGKTIWIVEGEKDAESLWRLGIAATTNPGGAGKGKWRHSYSDHFIGADVVLCGDNDDEGRAHMEAIERSLTGGARMIRVLDLAKTWPECPEKGGDVTDWIQAHRPNSGDALVRLAEQARVSRVYLHEALIRIMRHPRIVALPPGARCAVYLLASFWGGSNNGDLFLAASQLGRKRGVTNRYLQDAVKAGVLIMTEKGKGSRSTRYAIDPNILFPTSPRVSFSDSTVSRS